MHHRACLLASTLAFALVAAPPAASQTKKDKSSGLDRIEGTIQSLNVKDQSMTIRQRNRRNITWKVRYDDETAITYRNEDTTVEDLKVGRRVIVLGRFPEDSITLSAMRIEVRSGR